VTRTGSFADFAAMVLAIDLLTDDGRVPVPNWVISLMFKGAGERVEIARFQREAPAYTRARELARTLGLPLADETGGRVVTTASDALERPLAASETPLHLSEILAVPGVAVRAPLVGVVPSMKNGPKCTALADQFPALSTVRR